MEAWLSPLIAQFLAWLALPEHGLSTVFTIAFISATLLPMGSEPAVFGLVKLNSDLFWPAIWVATAGNTLGGVVSWWMGYGAHHAIDKVRSRKAQPSPANLRRPRQPSLPCRLEHRTASNALLQTVNPDQSWPIFRVRVRKKSTMSAWLRASSAGMCASLNAR